MSYSYEERTINSKNPLAKYAHRNRVKKSTEFVALSHDESLMDFGCGDGNFLSIIHGNLQSNKLIGFEPYMETKDSAKKIDIKTKWDEVEAWCDSNGFFDVITCFEVLEHFSRNRQAEAITRIKSILDPNGRFIISVPIEKGLPVIPKNLRRWKMNKKGNEHIYTIGNVISSFAGLKTSALEKIRSSDEFLPHMGFYFDDLEEVFSESFEIKRTMLSPFDSLPYFFNSQIFYELIPLD
tara:strand:+ start:326 stop:1039 length:714 start_codon:yes stop_codon:yes gene_type:complete